MLLIQEISGQSDNSIESEDVRATMRSWYPKFHLDQDPRVEIDNFIELGTELRGLAYLGVRNAAPPRTRF